MILIILYSNNIKIINILIITIFYFDKTFIINNFEIFFRILNIY